MSEVIKQIDKESPQYLKMYIAVLDQVPDRMTPTLVAHSILGAHLEKYINYEGYYLKETDLYNNWLHNSFRKCVVRVNRVEFEKIKQLNKVYLGHENTTLDGEKSCAVVYPMWNDEVPNVLKFAKLWKPVVQTIIYFDMDGVLADFNQMFQECSAFPLKYLNTVSKEQKASIKEVLFNYDFFRNMKPIQRGLDLLKYYQSKYEHVVILSATGNTSKALEIEQAKRDWLKEHVGDITAHFADKAENKFNVTKLYPSFNTHLLIDDRDKALTPWIAKGGIGVMFI